MTTWQDISTAPRDASVLVRIIPSPDNHTFADYPPTTHAAYVCEEGYICNYETLEPDNSLHGQYWRCTHWQAMPSAELDATA